MADEKSRFEPVAVSGYERSGSYGKVDVTDEYQPELRGRKGRRTLRQMTNDETIGAIRFAIDAFFRGTEWFADGVDDDELDEDLIEQYRQWTEDTLFSDLGDPSDRYTTVSWDDFLINALTCLDFGWSYCDVVPYQKSDGTIGVGNFIFVAQETLDGWKLDDNKRVTGLFQRPPSGVVGPYNEYIDRERALHFIASPFKGSPEGRSALRHIYRPWYYKSNYQAIEAILMERGCGFPVLYVDASVELAAQNGDAEAKRFVAWAEEFVANIKRNSQSGAVLYTSLYKNVGEDGSISYSNTRTMELKLETPGQSNSVDIDRAIKRCDSAIARGLVAGFLMLGTDGKTGSLALGQDQSNLFLKAIAGWSEMIATVVNRQLMPMLWELNGFPEEYMPYVRPGELTQKTMDQISAFVKDLAAAGIMLTDEETENYLREQGGLPQRPESGGDLPPIETED